MSTISVSNSSLPQGKRWEKLRSWRSDGTFAEAKNRFYVAGQHSGDPCERYIENVLELEEIVKACFATGNFFDRLLACALYGGYTLCCSKRYNDSSKKRILQRTKTIYLRAALRAD